MAEMRMRAFSIVVAFWGLTCSGWASVPPHERTSMIGGIPGGAQVAEDRGSMIAAITRALVSTMVGETIARSMDDTDRAMVLHALENGRAGASSRWRNPHSRNLYAVTLIRAYDAQQGPCLEYTVEGIIGGEKGDKVHSTACRRSDGNWEVANDN